MRGDGIDCREVWSFSNRATHEVRMMIRIRWTRLVAVVATLPASGATTVASHAIEPYTNAWIMTFHPDSGASAAGTLWEDRMDTVRWRGRLAMKREQVEHLPSSSGDRRVYYVNIFDPSTLAPYVSERRRADGVFIRITYVGDSAREVKSVPGWNAPRVTPGTRLDSTTRAFRLTRSFADFYNGMYATVFAGRPMSVGEQGAFAALRGDSVVDVPYRVTGKERVRGPGGDSTLAYRIDIGAPPGSSERYTSWISERPPYVLRLVSPQKQPPGYWSWDEK